MAAYKSVGYGSTGTDVSALQEKLNEKGYSLEVDGIFGDKTKAAVVDYQKKNALQVDGIAGEETWGSLTKSVQAVTQAPAVQPVETKTEQTPDYSKWQYEGAADKAYQDAVKKLQEVQGQVPQYSASYDEQMNQLFEKIMNREKFSYDANSDPMYQQYREQYMQQGQQAMQDTMGQAAALTGGYGSSYSQNAGQQAYNAYLQRLNEVMPELQQQAADRYAEEGAAMYDQYAMLGDLADTEYQRYQDAMSRYWQDVELQKDLADDAYERGYNNWWNAVQMQQAEDELAYQKYRDQVADEQWQKEFDEAQRQYNESLAAKSSGGSGGSSGTEAAAAVQGPEISGEQKESAQGSGTTSFTNVKRTIATTFGTGSHQKAIDQIYAAWDKLSTNQKAELKALAKAYGYEIEEDYE